MASMAAKRRTVGVSKAEARLVAKLRNALLDATGPGHRRRVSALELDSFQGVADLVVGELNGHGLLPPGVPRSRLKKFSFSTARVLASLRGRKTGRISEIARTSGLSEKTVRRELRRLQAASIVAILDRGRVLVLHGIISPFAEVVAFEVKVKDWKSGLRQARSYKSFANRAYLALPIDRAHSIKKHVKVFRLFKVGLVGIGRRGCLRWFTKTRKLSPISPTRNLYASFQLLRRTPLKLLKSSRPLWRSPGHRPNSEGGRARSVARR